MWHAVADTYGDQQNKTNFNYIHKSGEMQNYLGCYEQLIVMATCRNFEILYRHKTCIISIISHHNKSPQISIESLTSVT